MTCWISKTKLGTVSADPADFSLLTVSVLIDPAKSIKIEGTLGEF